MSRYISSRGLSAAGLATVVGISAAAGAAAWAGDELGPSRSTRDVGRSGDCENELATPGSQERYANRRTVDKSESDDDGELHVYKECEDYDSVGECYDRPLVL